MAGTDNNNNNVREILKKLPKVDLHVHLDGSLRVQTIWDLAQRVNHPLPASSPEELASKVQVSPDCQSLLDFLGTFEVFYPLLMDWYAMNRLAYEFCEDMAQENARYVEVRFAPVLQVAEGYAMRDVVVSVLEGLEKGCRDFGVDIQIILCCYRTESPESSIETVKLAKEFLGKGVVAIDLAGNEAVAAAPHGKAFELAMSEGIPITIHAGEAGTSENIKEALKNLGAARIGHGVHLKDDPELMKEIIERQIPLEMCLTSNVQTQVVDGFSSHPFPDYYRQGVYVTLNSDDPGVSNTTLSRELWLAHKHYGLNVEQIAGIVLKGLEAAFVPEEKKQQLVKSYTGEFKTLGIDV